MRGTFYTTLILAMPIYRSAIVEMDNAGAGSPRSHVSHEVGVDEGSKKSWISLFGTGASRGTAS